MQGRLGAPAPSKPILYTPAYRIEQPVKHIYGESGTQAPPSGDDGSSRARLVPGDSRIDTPASEPTLKPQLAGPSVMNCRAEAAANGWVSMTEPHPELTGDLAGTALLPPQVAIPCTPPEPLQKLATHIEE
mmetsp:Transcript_119294/g.345060  ORF Transcript_119294/g.345060 Transcript_119294/m.345060 type:complete len:131 (-) Transcript_119294:115-507(-)